MENPATWNEVEKAIAEAIEEHEEALKQHIIGIGLVKRIHDKLAAKGFLRRAPNKQRQYKTISVTDMQIEFVGQGMNSGDAAMKALEEFPKRVSELLDQGWEIVVQGDDTVHLRK